MKLLIATRNPHKLDEIQPLFDLPGLRLLSALDVPDLPEVVEDGDTLEANAIKKAVQCAEFSGLWCLADDTGLEVEALNGAPGVFSARYAGEDGNAEKNCAKLVRELTGNSNRKARFRTIIALCSPSGKAQTVEGICEGEILTEPRGDLGFGYDPLFLPEGFDKSFAELSLEEKNRISHRGKALMKAQATWIGLFEQEPEDWE